MNFSFLHLNINSLIPNLFDINCILNTKIFDLLFLNETKLDVTYPDSFFKHDHYKILRRDRNKQGGGVVIFVKNSIKIKKFNTNIGKIECIHLQINIKDQDVNFFSCYKPPDLCEKEFIDDLENVIYSVDHSDPLFLVGDLNMNADSNKYFHEFIKNNGLKKKKKKFRQ